MTLSRRDRILILAWSLPDALRSLTSRSTETRRLSPALWQICTPCDGNGQTQNRWGATTLCPTCHGAGRYKTDPYADGQPVSSHDDHPETRTHTRPTKCDRCAGDGIIPARYLNALAIGVIACPTCDGTGKVWIPLAPENDTHTQPVRYQLDTHTWTFRNGDWDALDSALEAMRSNGRRPLWRAFIAAYVEPPHVVTTDSLDALEHVEALMPSRVRVPKELVTAYAQRHDRARISTAARAARMGRQHRNREIRAALKLGHSTEHVARMFALSESQIRRIS